jgi:hypothetical protein
LITPGGVLRAGGRGTKHIEVGLDVGSGKQRPEQLNGVVVEEQLAQACRGAASFRLGRVGRQRHEVGRAGDDALKLEPHGEIDIRLAPVDDSFMVGRQYRERRACVAQVREQWYEELRKDAGLVGSLHGAPL